MHTITCNAHALTPPYDTGFGFSYDHYENPGMSFNSDFSELTYLYDYPPLGVSPESDTSSFTQVTRLEVQPGQVMVDLLALSREKPIIYRAVPKN